MVLYGLVGQVVRIQGQGHGEKRGRGQEVAGGGFVKLRCGHLVEIASPDWRCRNSDKKIL